MSLVLLYWILWTIHFGKSKCTEYINGKFQISWIFIMLFKAACTFGILHPFFPIILMLTYNDCNSPWYLPTTKKSFKEILAMVTNIFFKNRCPLSAHVSSSALKSPQSARGTLKRVSVRDKSGIGSLRGQHQRLCWQVGAKNGLGPS